eukprot:Gb_00770 [translate_table: standard]
MSQKQVTQHRPPIVNGSGCRRTDKDLNSRSDKTAQPTRSSLDISGNRAVTHGLYNHLNSENISPAGNSRLLSEGPLSGSRNGGLERTLHDRLLFMTMFLIGQPVEVQVKNGSIYSGIFHTANAEKDYGVVLKMARLTKDGSVKEATNDIVRDVAKRAPIKTLIIFAKDLVQVIAKDIPLSGEGMGNGRARENRHDIFTDSCLSQAHHIDMERELKPWKPDKDAPEILDLEHTFQSTWNRNWDQFETNKSLFGVESTFDEELYTTKLEKGPQMRDLERKASVIAREIEEQVTGNFHLAEERGVRIAEELESFDEETRFSSVLRGEDSSEDNEDRYIDNHNDETFGSAFASTEDALSISNDSKGSTSIAGESERQTSEASQTSSATSSSGKGLEFHSSDVSTNERNLLLVNGSESVWKEECSGSSVSVNFVEPSQPSPSGKDPLVIQSISPQERVPLAGRMGNSGSLVTEFSTSSVSSSLVSSLGSAIESASLKKSTLNPSAKEFKLNPNAKSYTPCFTSPRPAASVFQGPVYMASSVPPLTPLQGVQMGLGVNSLVQQTSQPTKFSHYNGAITAAGVSAAPYLQPVATFVPRVSGTAVPAPLPAQPAIKMPPPGQQIIGHTFSGPQPIRYSSQVAPLHQAPAYLQTTGQGCSQQMVFGQPGQVVYIQPYSHEMMQGAQVNPPQGSIPAQAALQQAQQAKHRGTTIHGMQFCVAAPIISGQQPYIQSTPISHLPNTLQPSPGVIAPTPVPGIQIPQSIVAGLGPTIQNGNGLAGGNGMWVGGKGATGNFQQ